MTRPQASAEAFVARLDPKLMEGVTVCISPLLDIVPMDINVPLEGYAGVLFTSANAVSCVENGNGRPAWCVGTRTAKKAEARGWRVERVARDANDLVASLKAAPVDAPLVHLAGKHRRGNIAERLTALGMPTDVAEVYDQPLRPLTADAQRYLSGDKRVIVPLFSPRTAAQFVSEAGPSKHVTLLAISEAVADTATDFGAAELYTVKAPNGEEMRRAVEKLFAGDSLA